MRRPQRASDLPVRETSRTEDPVRRARYDFAALSFRPHADVALLKLTSPDRNASSTRTRGAPFSFVIRVPV
jgi:hypothetical protein